MRLVVKVGTSTLTHSGGKLNIRRVEELCKVISDLKNAGNEVLLVSSGAIGMGVGKLNLGSRPHDMPTKQAAAAVGQCELMYVYDKFFGEYGHTVAQILITGDDVDNPVRRSHLEDTFFRLLQLGAIPVINENDTVSTEEIVSVGDNDTLAAIVSVIVKADLLVLLSDIDGLYTKDPHTDPSARLIPVVRDISAVAEYAGGAGSKLGTGGMATKISAAQSCLNNGIDMIIANGSRPEILYGAVAGEDVGTRFTVK